jgi:alkylhydroperoxidase family enzyme
VLGEATVQAALADFENAKLDPKLRITLEFLRKVTRDHAAVAAADVRPLLDAGITRAQIADALAVCFAFNVITRLADTFRFEIPPPSSFQASAKMLLSRGYKM